MKRVSAVLALVVMSTWSAHAAIVPPSKWTQNYIPTLDDWKAALLYNGQSLASALAEEINRAIDAESQKLNKADDTATNLTISSGAISSETLFPSPSKGAVSTATLATGILLTPQMYGAKADGFNDDTAAVQAAVSAICTFSHNGGEVYFPAGRYMVGRVTIPCQGVYLRGAGIGNRDQRNGTQIYNNASGSAPTFYFRAVAQNYAYGGGVSGMTFYNDGDNTSTGPNIEADYFQQFHIENVYSWHALYVVKLVGGRANHISHLYAEDILPGGIGIDLSGSGVAGDATGQLTRMDTPVINDVSLNAGATSGPTGTRHATGIYAHGFVQTLQMHNVEMTNPYFGVLVDCTIDGTTIQAGGLGACPGYFDMADVEVDFADIAAFRFLDFSFFKLRGAYAHGGNASSSYNNIQAFSPNFPSFGLEIIGGKFDQAQGSCIYSAVNNTRIVGADIHRCNLGGYAESTTGSAAVEFGIDTKTGLNFGGIISNNNMCLSGPDAPSTMDGVYIDSHIGYVSVTGNVFLGCRSGYNYFGSSSEMSNYANVGP